MPKISRAAGDTYAADAEAGLDDRAKREPNPNSTLPRDAQGVVEPGAPAGAASAVLRSVPGKVGTPGEPATPETVERDDETTLEKEKGRAAHSKSTDGGSPEKGTAPEDHPEDSPTSGSRSQTGRPTGTKSSARSDGSRS